MNDTSVEGQPTQDRSRRRRVIAGLVVLAALAFALPRLVSGGSSPVHTLSTPAPEVTGSELPRAAGGPAAAAPTPDDVRAPVDASGHRVTRDSSVTALGPLNNDGYVRPSSSPDQGPVVVRLDTGLVETGRTRLSPRLIEVTFHSDDLAGDTKVRILLPTGYSSGNSHYPVLYLLNGGGGSYLDWTTKGDAEKLTTATPAIVVMPDGGQGGNYTDWFGNDGRGVKPRWESFHIGRLLPWVDGHFRTIAERSQRAVAGLSMGGNGALHYAGRHPDLFVAAASFSGANDVFHPLIYPITETTEIANGAAPGAVFGPRATEEVRWHASNPVDLARNLKGTWLSLAFGNGQAGGPDGGQNPDPIEQAVYDCNVTLHDALLAAGVPHRYNSYGAGGHNWYYWQRDLKQALPGILKVFGEHRATPKTFTYTSIDPSYSVWGWTVQVTRPAPETSEMVEASGSGFSLRGSGTVRVTTAGLFTPGSTHTVSLRDVGGSRTMKVRAGPDGRLRVPVDLGTGNASQQYSPQAQLTGTVVREAHVTFS